MKNNIKKYMKEKSWITLLFLSVSMLLITSCEDYLDKAPEAEIKEEFVFSNAYTFQGYVEDIYQGVVDVTIGRWADYGFNFGDDVINASPVSINAHLDRGDSWWWQVGSRGPYSWSNRQYNNTNLTNDTRSYWEGGWFNLRRTNIGLEKLPLLVNATDEERRLIEGQLLFFRGYYHWEILKSWGGIPYISRSFKPSDDMRLTRLSYRQVADSINRDLRKAVELLPVDWDNTQMGQATIGENKGRLDKGAAWGYIGKNWLYAASPLMNGGSETDDYDHELCLKAAEAFAEIFKLEDQGVYELTPWGNYSDNFYRITSVPPYTKEYIFNNPIYGNNEGRTRSKVWDRGEFIIRQLGAWDNIASVTQNYIEEFGMENGLPITDPNSGYDPSNPWENRDPRFDYNIVLDGERIVKKDVPDSYAQFYVGGRHRGTNNVITGFMHKKFKHITINRFDRGWGNWRAHNWFYEVPNLRLADVYLMYAEAVNEALGPDGSVNGGPTAVEAVNIVRRRVKREDGTSLPDLAPQYSSTKEQLRESIRNERAVELAFEAHRYDDLRRWRLAHLPEYKEKFVLEFDKDHSYFTKKLFLTRVFKEKHYWMPFPRNLVELYEGFEQNPGW